MGLFDALRMMMGGNKHPADTPPPTGVITPAAPAPAAPNDTTQPSIQPSAPDVAPSNPSTVPVAEPPTNSTVVANDSTDLPSITPEMTEPQAPGTSTVISSGDTTPPSAPPEVPAASITPEDPLAGMSEDEKPKDGSVPPQA